MSLSRIAAAVGALLLSKRGRRLAGRHAGKVALATLAWELYQSRRARAVPAQAGTRLRSAPKLKGWSGRSPRHR